MTIKSKVVSAFLVLIGVTILSNIYISFNLNNIESNIIKLSDKDFSGITVLLEADRDSYQSNVALSQIINLKNKEEAEKLIKKGVNDNLEQVRQRFDKFTNFLKDDLKNEQAKFEEFDKYYDLTKKHTNQLIKLVNDESYSEAQNYYFNNYLKDYESMRDTIDYFTGASYKIVDANKSDTVGTIDNSVTTFIIIGALIILLTLFFTIILGKTINKSITEFKDGLLGFFSYINRDSTTVELLNDKSNDEFAKIAVVVNENIDFTKKLFEKDTALINQVKSIVENVKNGNLNDSITLSTENKELEELKTIFNEMLSIISKNISNDLNAVKNALFEYQKLNFRHRISGANGDTVEGLNTLANIINEMLAENKTNGLTLQNNSTSLLDSVEILSQSSTEAAASIEETAAALEEITSNINSSTQTVVKMASNANELKSSVVEGEKMATKTTSAMDAINEQVSSINEAITVIDQIAFQTNILSLNAAVEAATAGEAGKGFAVVAQEVRNLAARSAEAAKEIKDLVETATTKANDGKSIADKMIVGYEGLNKNIINTLELINIVENTSKEQQAGISQINDAVNILDAKTQQNAQIANEAKDIASQTQVIADEIVKDANEKEFEGKESVKARTVKVSSVQKTNKPVQAPVKAKETIKVTPKPTAEKEPTAIKKAEPTKTTFEATSSDDEWESF